MSSQHETSSHAWLFSFVDLAFLLLMVMSQLADPNAGPPLGEIIVPEINAPDARPVRVAARASWQLRVHPPQEGFAPFELSRPDEEPTGIRLDKAALQRGEVRQRTPIDGGQAHRWNGREAGRGDPAGTAAECIGAPGYLTETEMAAQLVKVMPGQ